MPQSKPHTAPHMKDTLDAALGAKQEQHQGHGPAHPQQQQAEKSYDPDLSMEQTAVKNEVTKPRKGLQDRNN